MPDLIPTEASPFEEKKEFLLAKWKELGLLAASLGCSYTSFFSYGPIETMIVNDFRTREEPKGQGPKIVVHWPPEEPGVVTPPQLGL